MGPGGSPAVNGAVAPQVPEGPPPALRAGAGIDEVAGHYRHHASYDEAMETLVEALGPLAGLRVLEAGSGSASHFDLSRCHVTAIDISRQQLDRNTSVQEKVCADLHEFDRDDWAQSFDLIISWFVLEHLHSPIRVLDKFLRWLKPDGRLLVSYPNPRTVKGVVTRWTPLIVHRLFYRVARGTPLSASRIDAGPFPTVLHPDLRLDRFARHLRSRGFRPDWVLTAESYQTRFLERFASRPLVGFLNRRLAGRHCPGLSPGADELILLISRSGTPA